MTGENPAAQPKGPMNPAQAASRITAAIAPKAEATAGEADKNAQPKKAAPAQKPAQQNKTTQPAKPAQQDKPVKAATQNPLDAEVDTDQSDEGTEGAEDQEDILSDPADDEGEQSDDQAAEASDDEGTEDGDILDGEDEVLHTVVVDGKEMQVPYSELIEGYQRGKDYTRKTQELAKQRKEVEALQEQVKELPQAQKAYTEGAERFVKNSQLVLAALEHRFMPKAPDEALRASDPAAYIKQLEAFQEGQQFRKALVLEQQKLASEATAEHKKLVQKGRTELYKLYPEMQEASNRQKLREYVHQHGVTDEQIMNEPNPILFMWADKARKYDELVAAQKARKADQPKPKVLKQNKSVESHKALQARKQNAPIVDHKKTKTVASAGRALESVLNLGKKRS
ncbi:MAG: hypothetical protein E6Q97_09325 [Desulfurellales bacterium]|nr:MAG: hypothetical protein E6Q97_09325 [Desulfurellales bacterium]